MALAAVVKVKARHGRGHAADETGGHRRQQVAGVQRVDVEVAAHQVGDEPAREDRGGIARPGIPADTSNDWL